MAFLCPSRLGNNKERKKKKEQAPLFGRITGSDSVDTLVRVGLEKRHGLSVDSKMVAVRDFTACAERELSVRQSQEVYLLYTENTWAYVLTEDNREGFVPLPFLSPWSRRSVSPPILEVTEEQERSGDASTDLFSVSESDSRSLGSRTHSRSSNSSWGVYVFRKQSYGRYVVVFDFEGVEENDMCVEQCEVVTVLNMEDPAWYWVRRSTGEEGFVPRPYLCPYPADLNLSSSSHSGKASRRDNAESLRQRRRQNTSDIKELVTVKDFSGHSQTDLSVKRGDILFADLSNQGKADWLWAYSPLTDRYGYLPRDHLEVTDQLTMAVV